MSQCCVLEQAKKSRLMLPVSLLFQVKVCVVKFLPKIADELPCSVQVWILKKDCSHKTKKDSIQSTCLTQLIVSLRVYYIFLPRKWNSTSLGQLPHSTQSLNVKRLTYQLYLTVGVDALLSCPLPSPQLHEGKGGGYLKPPIEESWICICNRYRMKKRGPETGHFGNYSLCKYVCIEVVVVLQARVNSRKNDRGVTV